MEAWLEKWSAKCKSLSALYLALVFFLVIGIMVLNVQKNGTDGIMQEKTEGITAVETGETVTEMETPEPVETAADIFVHISGQVNHPGVVCLPAGSRVFEAVEKAGGMTEDGDLESVNLAEVVQDQQKIVVGSLEERSMAASVIEENSGVSASENLGKININTASKTLLESLPGIGPVIAENIIVYRQTKGAFQTIEEIKNVPRIGDATFANIQGLIGVR